MGAQGTTTLNFGAAPGTNHVSVDVVGQAAIAADSAVEAWIMGVDSTAEHTTYEHMFLAGYISTPITAIVVGTGFTINGITELRLTGNIDVRWVWN